MTFDRHINDKGYVLIWMPDHPSNSQGYILEHRYVVECALGRYLESSEVVHHINEVKTDNRIGNLYLCSPEEHVRIHNRNARFSNERKKNIRKGVRKYKQEQRSKK